MGKMMGLHWVDYLAPWWVEKMGASMVVMRADSKVCH